MLKMKILMLCLRLVFDVNNKTISRTTGYSYAVRSLASELAQNPENKIDCICVNDEPKLKAWNGVNILQRNILKACLKSNPTYLIKGVKSGRATKRGLKEILRTEYYYLFEGWIEDIIRKGNYDFVSIQGFTRYSMPYVIACENVGVKYGVSFHALDCFGKNYRDKDEEFMTSMLKFFADNSVPCTFISTTMLEKAMGCLSKNEKETASFSVILNGVSQISKKGLAIKGSEAEDNEKICLCSGNINQRKNQYQLLKAYSMLDERVKNKLKIVLVGNLIDERVSEIINTYNLKERIVVCGAIPREELGRYFSRASFIALVSLSEGFGLSIIEGFSFGLPALLWSDLDITKDINDPNCVMMINDRSDEALASSLEKMLERKWDKEYILKYSSQFSIEKMAEKYLDWFSCCKGEK